MEAALRAKPIEKGHVEARTFKVYGSQQSLDVLPHLHYSNILALFSNGKLIGIYSGYTVPGGERWRQQIRASFVDMAL